ncbi:MAG: DUF1573 domain-containing protein [Odoribacter sp.]|nr:DUF1573 domain-containing protein [Odoribacter sp.]
MKSLLLTFFCMLAANLIFSQGIMEIKQPTLVLDNLLADDQPQTKIFEIKNTGNRPFIITRATSMSAQVQTKWTREPIAPGKSGKIQITFTSSHFKERFDYKIMVYTNLNNQGSELRLTGNVTDNPAKPTLLYKYTLAGVKFRASNISFGDIYTWQKITDTIYYLNTRKEPVRIEPLNKPTYLHFSFQPAVVAPNQRGAMIITFDAPKRNDYGYNYDNIMLSVNGTKDFRNRITITANITEDFSKLTAQELANAPIVEFATKELSFGEIKQGEKAHCDFVIKNAGKRPLFIRKTKASCGCTAVTIGNKAVQPGQSTTIRATFDSTGRSGRQYKTITVITNDPKHPETTLRIRGNIKVR